MNDFWDTANNLYDTKYGGYSNGSWNNFYFKSDKQALFFGCFYNDYHQSWGNTYAGSAEIAFAYLDKNDIGKTLVYSANDDHWKGLLAYEPNFFGAKIRFIPDLGECSYFAGAINIDENYYKSYKALGLSSPAGLDLMHEFGHYLQDKLMYGEFLYIFEVVIPGLIDINLYHTGLLTLKGYEHTSTEVLANTMAYFYFGCPDYFIKNSNYPINTNWLSGGLIYKLYYHDKFNF